MLFDIDHSEIELLIDDVLEEESSLPKIITTSLNETFGDKRNSEEVCIGFNILFKINKIKGGKLHTSLHPFCFEATIGELKVNENLSKRRFEKYCLNFKKNQPATYNFLYSILTEDAMFGAILAHNTLRKKDESNKMNYISSKLI